MTPFIALQTAEESSSRAKDRLVPRLVIAEDGRIAHASEGFEQLIRGSALALEGSKLQDLIMFCDPEAALRDQPFAMISNITENPWIRAIVDGLHPLQLRDRGTEIFHFQFEWMQIGERARYLVASMAEPGKEPEHLSTEEAIEILAGKTKKTAVTPSAITAPVVDTPAAPVITNTTRTPVIRAKEAFRNADPQAGRSDVHLFLDLSDDIMIRADRNGHLHTANRAFYEHLGYKVGQLADLNLIDMIAPDDRANVRTIFLSLMRGDNLYDRVVFEARVTGADNCVHWMDWRMKRSGETVFILCRDLTQSKEHEARLIRHQQQLSEAEAIAHMGYWRWVVGSRDIVWSDEIYRIFGVTRENFHPTMDTINAVLHRRDVGRMVQAFQRAMIEQNSYDMEFRITRPDGEVRYIRCEGRCEQDETGDVIALFGIMQDMTEHTRRERELREAKDQAERAYATKSQFLANMSHELRTPLNAIIGFSEMMQRQLLGPIGTERYLEYIDGIRQSGEHLLDLISDILDMSKIEAGKYHLDIENVNVAKITRLAVHMVEGRAKEACVEVSANDFGDDMPITADRRAVLQMTLNLLSNSIKFTEPGGSVRVTLTPHDDYVTLQVADTGIGIPANMLQDITKPFEQAANHYTRSHEGSGLGLAITKELVEMHGGRLDLQSKVGVGTTVTITLPRTAKISEKVAV